MVSVPFDFDETCLDAKWSWGKALFQASFSTRNTALNQKEHQNTSNRSNTSGTSDTSKPSKSSNRKVNLWQVWTCETIRNKCLCHLRVIEVHLLQYFIWLEEIYWVLPAMALYLRLTSEGFVLVSYLTYPSYTWVLLGFFLLKSFSTYGSLSCQSSLQQVSLWTCLTCEFLLQDFTNKTKILSFS